MWVRTNELKDFVSPVCTLNKRSGRFDSNKLFFLNDLTLNKSQGEGQLTINFQAKGSAEDFLEMPEIFYFEECAAARVEGK